MNVKCLTASMVAKIQISLLSAQQIFVSSKQLNFYPVKESLQISINSFLLAKNLSDLAKTKYWNQCVKFPPR